MSREKRDSNRKRKKIFRITLISFIFLYFFIRSIPVLFGSVFKTILPESVIVEDKITAEGIVIRKESLYKADIDGRLEKKRDEGEKISAESRVANLILLDNTSALNQELEELEEKIKIFTATERDSEAIIGDEGKIEENIEKTIDELQSSLIEGNYKNSEILKGKISIYSTKSRGPNGEDTLISQSLDSLQDRYDEIKEQISNNTVGYFPKEAGVISFKIDNYEEIFSFENKDRLTYSDFKAGSIKDQIIEDDESINAGDNLFKIIDNFEWYLVLKIDEPKELEDYEVGNSIILKSRDKEGDLKGIIQKLEKKNGKALMQCKFTTNFQDYYDKRFLELNIVKSKYNSFKIPTKSIVKLDEQEGVYVKSFSGIIKFKPVEILKEEDKFTYVNSGDKNNNIYIDGHDEPLKTITNFDEILRRTINIKEGMIIN